MGMFADISTGKAETEVPKSVWEDIETSKVAPKGFWGELPDALERGLYNVVENVAGSIKYFSEHPIPTSLPWWLKKAGIEKPQLWIAKQAGKVSSAARLAGEAPEIQPEIQQTASEFVASVLGEAAPYVGGALATGAIGGVPAAATFSFAVEGQEAYKNALETGATPEEAAIEMYIVGGINSLIEVSNVGRILGRMKNGGTIGKALVHSARNKAWKEVLKSGKVASLSVVKTAFEEALEEALQGTTAEISPAILRGKEIPGGLTGFLHRRGSEALAGGIVGAAFGGAGFARGALQQTVTELRETASPVQQLQQEVQESRRIERLQEQETVFETPETQSWDLFLAGEEVSPVPAEVDAPAAELSVTDKFANLIVDIPIKGIRTVTEEEITAERGVRFGAVEKGFQTIADPDEAISFAKQQLKGEYSKGRFDPFTEEQFSVEDWKELKRTVLDSPIPVTSKLHAIEALDQLQQGLIPTQSRMEALEAVVGPEVATLLEKVPQSLKERAWRGLIDLLNLPRTLMASGDLSAMGRQGIIFAPSHPKIWLRNVHGSFQSLFSEEAARLLDKECRTGEYSDLAAESGLELTEYGGRLTKREESFLSNLAKKIPLVGTMVTASERAYTVGLNKLRYDIFSHYAEQWEGQNRTRDDYKRLASFINHATGRGTGKFLAKHGPSLSAAFFSPRFFASRFQLLGDGARALVDVSTGNPSPVNKVIAGELAEFVGAGMLALLLASLAGLKVSLDPRSADFGKIQAGKTRIDFWAGYTPIVRTATRLMTGETVSAETAEKYPADRKDTVVRFLQSKLSPLAASLAEAWQGQTFMGEALPQDSKEATSYVLRKLTPLFMQDVYEASRYQGLATGATVAPLAFMGVGTQTYIPTVYNTSSEVKNSYANKIFGANWDQLGAKAQEALRTMNPKIGEYERLAKAERHSYDFQGAIIQKQMDAGRNVFNEMPKSVRQEMKLLGVTFGGFSTLLNRRWKLNESRFKDYQNLSSEVAQKVLSQVVQSSTFQNAPDDLKRTVLEEVINRIKKAARQQVVAKANFADLERLVQ